MLLAQDTVTNNMTVTLGAIGCLITLIGGQLRGWLSDRAKAKRDDAQVDALNKIVQSNAAIVSGQVAQNGKLSTVVEVNKAYHEEIIRTLQGCQYRKQQTESTQ